MHFINLMVNYLDRKYGVPTNLFFSKISPEVQATLSLQIYETSQSKTKLIFPVDISWSSTSICH